MRRRDWADDEADRIFGMVQDGASDEAVIEAISDALRKAAGVQKPPSEERQKMKGKK